MKIYRTGLAPEEAIRDAGEVRLLPILLLSHTRIGTHWAYVDRDMDQSAHKSSRNRFNWRIDQFDTALESGYTGGV